MTADRSRRRGSKSSWWSAILVVLVMAIWSGWVAEAGASTCCFCPACNGFCPADCHTNGAGTDTESGCASFCNTAGVGLCVGCTYVFSAAGHCASNSGPCVDDPTPLPTATPTITETPTETPTVTETPTQTQTRTPTLLGLGAVCSDPGQCSSDFCVDGVCCNTICAGENESCDQPGREGICQGPVPVTAPTVSHRVLIAIGILMLVASFLQLRRRARGSS